MFLLKNFIKRENNKKINKELNKLNKKINNLPCKTYKKNSSLQKLCNKRKRKSKKNNKH